MLSDVLGPKVHFGVLPQQRPRDHHELRPGRDIFPPLAELVVGEKAQPATASSLLHRKSVPVTSIVCIITPIFRATAAQGKHPVRTAFTRP